MIHGIVNKDLERAILEVTFNLMVGKERKLPRTEEEGIAYLLSRASLPTTSIVPSNTLYKLSLTFREYKTTAYDFTAATGKDSTSQQLYEHALINLETAMKNRAISSHIIAAGIYQDRFGWLTTWI